MRWLKWLLGNREWYLLSTDYLTDSKASKHRQLVDLAVGALKKSGRVLLVCHFDQSLESLAEVLVERNQPAQLHTTPFDEHRMNEIFDTHHSGNIEVIQSHLLIHGLNSTAMQPTRKPDLPPVTILVAERHPQLEFDQAVLDFAEQLVRKPRIQYLLSMDDFMAAHVVGRAAREIFEDLRVLNDGPIASSMVCRRFARFQRRIAHEGWNVENPQSELEWFEKYPAE